MIYVRPTKKKKQVVHLLLLSPHSVCRQFDDSFGDKKNEGELQ